MSKHTQTPWRTDHQDDEWWILAGEPYDDQHGLCEIAHVASTDGNRNPLSPGVNAARIVHCVNTYDALVEALEGLLKDRKHKQVGSTYELRFARAVMKLAKQETP